MTTERHRYVELNRPFRTGLMLGLGFGLAILVVSIVVLALEFLGGMGLYMFMQGSGAEQGMSILPGLEGGTYRGS